jgi:hypothetical protein
VSKNLPSLSIVTEKVCFIIIKAREFDVKDVVTDPDDASNATDDSMLSVWRTTGKIPWPTRSVALSEP